MKAFLKGSTVAALSLMASLGNAQVCDRSGSELRLSAVGDILIHRALYEHVVNQPDRFLSLFKKVVPHLKQADITYGNLEGPLAPGRSLSKQVRPANFNEPVTYDGTVYSGTNFVFNFHPSLAIDLKSAGFDVVSTANNHTMDRRGDGVDLTIESLRRAQIQFAGTRSSSEQSDGTTIVESNGKKVLFIACAEMLNGMPDPRKQVVRCGEGMDDVTPLIQKAKREGRADAIVVTPHWGEEYKLVASGSQVARAKKWADAGATAIIGNHPHVLQPIRWISTQDRRQVLVAYSLGNFIAGQSGVEKTSTAILHIDFENSSRGLQVKQFSFTPVYRTGYPELELRVVDRSNSVYMNHIESVVGRVGCYQRPM